MTQQELKEKVAIVAQSSNVFRKLGKFIEENWTGIGMLNATEVAIKAEVSQGSVTRFCNILGFSGYNEFSKVWKQSIYENLSAPNRLKNVKEKHADLSRIIEEEQQNLQKLPEIVLGEHYKQIVRQLVEKEKIVLMSARISATLLDEFYYTFSKIRDNVKVVTPETPEWNNIVLENPKNVFVFVVMFPRYPNSLIKEVEELHNAKFEIGLLTDNILCPLTQLSKYHLEVPISSASFFDIYNTPRTLINYLIMDVAKHIDNLEDRMTRLEEFESKSGVYYKP